MYTLTHTHTHAHTHPYTHMYTHLCQVAATAVGDDPGTHGFVQLPVKRGTLVAIHG